MIWVITRARRKPWAYVVYRQLSHGNILLKKRYIITFLYHLLYAITVLKSRKYNGGPSWSYGSLIYNDLCNQSLSPLKLWVRTQFMAGCCWYNFMWYSLSVTWFMLVVFFRDWFPSSCEIVVIQLYVRQFVSDLLYVCSSLQGLWFPSSCEVVVIHLYVIQFVSDLMYVSSFLQVLWFPPSCEVILIQLYVRMFVSDLLCVCSSLQVLWFPPSCEVILIQLYVRQFVSDLL